MQQNGIRTHMKDNKKGFYSGNPLQEKPTNIGALPLLNLVDTFNSDYNTDFKL